MYLQELLMRVLMRASLVTVLIAKPMHLDHLHQTASFA